MKALPLDLRLRFLWWSRADQFSPAFHSQLSIESRETRFGCDLTPLACSEGELSSRTTTLASRSHLHFKDPTPTSMLCTKLIAWRQHDGAVFAD